MDALILQPDYYQLQLEDLLEFQISDALEELRHTSQLGRQIRSGFLGRAKMKWSYSE
jgi:hypothetical protein